MNNQKQKIERLIQTGIEENIELAWALDASQNFGIKQKYQKMYEEFLDDLKGVFTNKERVGLKNKLSRFLVVNDIFFSLGKTQEKILKEIPQFLLHSPNMKDLCLNNNYIKEIPKEIKNLKRLETLDVSNNPIERISLELTKLPKLKTFYCKGNNLSKEDKQTLERALSLKGVDYTL